jgi:serine/threonine protein kinase
MTEKIGQYQVMGKLGEGAQSEILHIRRSSDARQYALKVVPVKKASDQKYVEQAEHEFRIAEMLDHPNLIKIHALETEKDWLFQVRKVLLLIEYVNGKSLDAGPKLSIPRLVQVFVQMASGLVHMHRKGIYHADIKPSNVLLSRTGQVKIIDYGLAWTKGHTKSRTQGTPEYMAPETCANRIVNERSDIYNLGATMYRMVTGELPPQCYVEEGTGIQMVERTFKTLLKPVAAFNPKAPKPLAELIQQCIAFNPPQRPARMSEVQGMLDHMADELVQSSADRLDMMEND